ncbi:hypothetical protein [Psychrobacter immobilis]|uniref:hypothetical protein n=1 Tax=Psychrobacter immobilis TaxID=498 RepID=UPI001D11A0CF|nr:hypothetical protein [Psychrobacter immobilis]
MHYKITLFAFALSLMGQVGCTPAPEPNGELYGAGFVPVRDLFWPVDNDKPYPFTVDYGEIVCGQPHAGIGRQVFFLPESLTDESYIGTPLNKAASDSLKQDGLEPNVPYSIKEGADLSEAIQIGLRVCDEQKELLNRTDYH